MSARETMRLDEDKFSALVARKWTVSLVLSAIILAAYYGFILLLAFGREFLAARTGEAMTVGIPVGLGLIVLAWALTGVYVFWANGSYDKAVDEVVFSIRSEEQ